MAAGIAVTISAKDAASGVIDRVNTGLENLNRRTAAARAPIDRMSASLGRFGRLTGVSQVASDVGGLGRQIGNAAASLGRFAPALGAITGAGSVAGLASLVANWSKFGSRLGFDAQRIGVNTTQLQGLQGAAALAGSSAEALTSGMQALGDNLAGAPFGRSPETVAALSALGLSFRDTATGGRRLAQDVLPEIADKIADIKDPATQALFATKLFGSAGESLLPVLRLGSKGITELTAAAARYGAWTPAGIEAARQMEVAQRKLGLAFTGVGNAISEKVAPVLVPLLTDLANWVGDHRSDVGRFFGDIAQRLREWADSGGPKRLLDQVERIGLGIQGVVDKVGGWTNALEIVGGAIALKMLAPLISVVAVVARLTTALTIGLVEAFGKAGIAASLFSVETLKLPVFRAIATILGTGGFLAGLGYLAGKGWAESDKVEGREGQLRDLNRQQRQGAILEPKDGFGPDGSPVSGGSLPPPGVAPTTVEQEQRAKQARDQLVGLGWSPEQAAGIVANLHKESRFDPGAVGDGGTAYGLPQWHGDRRANVERGLGISMIGAPQEAQIRGIDWELRHTEKAAGDRLQQAKTAAEAGDIVSRYYERPAATEAEASSRGLNAQRWEARLAAPAPPVPPVPAAAPLGAQGAPGPDGKATVRVTFDNPPPNLRTTTVAQGGLRVETPTLGAVP